MFVISLVVSLYRCNPLNFTEFYWPPLCKTGLNQNPISFPFDETKYLHTENQLTAVDYLPLVDASFEIAPDLMTYGVQKVRKSNPGNTVLFSKNGIENTYELINFHIHMPAEHRFGGYQPTAELHLVHKKKLNQGEVDQDPGFRYLVIGVLFEIANEENPILAAMNIESLQPFQNLDLTPWVNTRNSFLYMEGGLTTPPCSELVQFMIIAEEFPMSLRQYDTLTGYISRLYEKGNARAVQSLNNRKVYYRDNSTGQDSQKGESIRNFLRQMYIKNQGLPQAKRFLQSESQ